MEVGLTTWGFTTVNRPLELPWNTITEVWIYYFLQTGNFSVPCQFSGVSRLISSINKFGSNNNLAADGSPNRQENRKNNQPQLGPKFKFPKEVSCIISLPCPQPHNLNEFLADNHVTQLETTLPTTKSTVPSKPLKIDPFKQEIHIENQQF